MRKMSTTRNKGDGDNNEVSSDNNDLPCYFVDLNQSSLDTCTSVTDSRIGQFTGDLTGTNSGHAAMTTETERSPEKKRYR